MKTKHAEAMELKRQSRFSIMEKDTELVKYKKELIDQKSQGEKLETELKSSKQRTSPFVLYLIVYAGWGLRHATPQ